MSTNNISLWSHYFVQPYKEGYNLITTTDEKILLLADHFPFASWIENSPFIFKTTHTVVGLILLIPIINSIVQAILDLAEVEFSAVTHDTLLQLEGNVITSLDLSNQRLGSIAVARIVAALKTNISLKELTLSKCNITDAGAIALADVIKNHPTLQFLDLENNAIGTEGAEALITAIEHNQSFQFLDLDRNQVRAENLQRLFTTLGRRSRMYKVIFELKNNLVNALDLVNKIPKNRGWFTLLIKSLKRNISLSFLYLGANKMDALEFKKIAETLKTNKTLTTLFLAETNLDSVGVEELAEMLKVNRTLTTLGLGINKIDAVGAKKFADALKVNTTLEELYLDGNNINPDGVAALVEILSINTKIKIHHPGVSR